MWKLSHLIVLKYLKGFTEPMAKMRAKYDISNDIGVNHCVMQSSLPQQLALCVGAMTMLLQNVLCNTRSWMVLWGWWRPSFTRQPNGPAENNALAKYIIVDFKQSTLSADEPMIKGARSIWISVPVAKNRCEKNCCSVSAIPLQVCIAMTIHKAQVVILLD